MRPGPALAVVGVTAVLAFTLFAARQDCAATGAAVRDSDEDFAASERPQEQAPSRAAIVQTGTEGEPFIDVSTPVEVSGDAVIDIGPPIDIESTPEYMSSESDTPVDIGPPVELPEF